MQFYLDSVDGKLAEGRIARNSDHFEMRNRISANISSPTVSERNFWALTSHSQRITASAAQKPAFMQSS